jgi:hypothetical protein
MKLRLPNDVAKWARSQASRRKVGMARFIAQVVREHLDQQRRQ